MSMIRVRLYRHDQGAAHAVGFLDFFDKGEAPPPYVESDLPPGLIAPAERRRILSDLSHRKVVGTVAGYEWRVEYA
jgi:hypothetical protein